MSLRLVAAAAETENLDDFHLSRLLVLLRSSERRRTKNKTVAGITKLAKMDFLLRYPVFLERALNALGKDPRSVHVEVRERISIESKMIRFRYGPWDSRYRRWLGLLLSKGLVHLHKEGNTVHVGLTDRGREVSDSFRLEPLYQQLAKRSDLVVQAAGAMSATALKDFVYRVFPELTDMKWGQEIGAQGEIADEV